MLTSSFTKPHKKKSRNIRSAGLGGEPESGLSSAKPTLGQLLVKNVVTSMWICGGVSV